MTDNDLLSFKGGTQKYQLKDAHGADVVRDMFSHIPDRNQHKQEQQPTAYWCQVNFVL